MEPETLKSLLALAVLTAFLSSAGVLQAGRPEVKLMVLELVEQEGKEPRLAYAVPAGDDSGSNHDYKLLPFHWYGTASIWVNPSNKYGFSTQAVVSTITTSAQTWDQETGADVFSYKGTSKKSAGRYDGYNVISWGPYRINVIAVTYIWYIGDQIIETDTRMNTLFKWSLAGEAGKMDVQNIMTHELGHWCGLDDLYDEEDYWLTMYGYSAYGETYKRDLGVGDIDGLEAVYGP